METLTLLGRAPPSGMPDFRSHNQQRWRSRKVARALMGAYRLGESASCHLPTKLLRNSVVVGLGLLFYAPLRANLAQATPRSLPAGLRSALRERFRDDVGCLTELLGRDLSAWLKADG